MATIISSLNEDQRESDPPPIISALNHSQRDSEGSESHSPSKDDIQKLAYEYWEKEGRPTGRDLQHWLLAEEALRASHSLRHLQNAE